MKQLLIILVGLLYSCCALAKSTYQIDVILFAQPQAAIASAESAADRPLIPMQSNAITLTPGSGTYKLLPGSSSALKDQYYLLSRRSPYPVLGHYSWKQAAHNKTKIALPFIAHNGWQIQGTMYVSEAGYYTLDALLQVSSPNNPQSSFSVTQKQRLKENVVYYLDNEKIGMLVTIHKA